MNHPEEQLLLNSELGKAIAQWGYAEGQLLRVVQRCTPEQHDSVAAAFLTIENFRSKLSFCDALITAKAAGRPWFSYWGEVKARCQSLAAKRNQLAHGWHALYIDGSSGKRFGITPSLQADGHLIHRGGQKPPHGTLFLRDVVLLRMGFHALTAQICNVYELLGGRRRPFPDADGPLPSAPTIRQLENQLRLELGRKPRPQSPTHRQDRTDQHITPPSAASDA
jgi:hypothetical protein